MTRRGFVIVRAAGRNIPRVLCERCGEPSGDVGMAGGVHSGREGPVALTVLCKVNQCLAAPEYRRLPWMGLGNSLVFLLQNTGIRTLEEYTQAVEGADMLAMIG